MSGATPDLDRLNQLTQGDFADHLNTVFQAPIETDGGDATAAIPFKLTEVNALPNSNEPRPDKRGPFSLILHAPIEGQPAQGIYTLNHDKMGTLSLFLVPVGSDSDGVLFEAVFT